MCEKPFNKKDQSVQAKIEQPELTSQDMEPTPGPANEPVAGAGVRGLCRRMSRWIRQMAAGSEYSSTIRHTH